MPHPDTTDVTAAAPRIEYTCPMHPQIVRDRPGNCPICGMVLEPRTITLEETNPELSDMTKRFRASVALSVPLLALMASEMLPDKPVQSFLGLTGGWVQFLLAAPVVVWAGYPFFERGWQSILNRYLNMFTLIALGTGSAFLYSVVALLLPNSFPDRSVIRTPGASHSTSNQPPSSRPSFCWDRSSNSGPAAAHRAHSRPCSNWRRPAPGSFDRMDQRKILRSIR